jgi:hypothetical protein
MKAIGILRAKAKRAWRTPLRYGVLTLSASLALADEVWAQGVGNSPHKRLLNKVPFSLPL